MNQPAEKPATQAVVAQAMNPYGAAQAISEKKSNALITQESQRAMIEVMTGFEVARRFPRDPAQAMANILAECNRPSLAEMAVFNYKRGGTEITGPSIRLLEAIARHWGHIQFGYRELERRQGASTVQAYARDLQSNALAERVFDVKHWRDTQGGGYLLKEERDISEMIANQAQRKVRTCIEALIPGDVLDAAVAQCDFTSRAAADTSPEGLKKLLALFEEFGVTQAMIEARIQSKLEAIKPVQFVSLRKAYVSLRDGMATPADFFDTAPVAGSTATKGDPAAKPAAAAQPDLKKEVDNKKGAKKKLETPPAGEQAPTAAAAAGPQPGTPAPTAAPQPAKAAEAPAPAQPAAAATPTPAPAAAAPLGETIKQQIMDALAKAPDAGTLENLFEVDFKDDLEKMPAGEWKQVRAVYTKRLNELEGA